MLLRLKDAQLLIEAVDQNLVLIDRGVMNLHIQLSDGAHLSGWHKVLILLDDVPCRRVDTLGVRGRSGIVGLHRLLRG